MKRFITYSHIKVAIFTGIISLGFVYATIYASSFPDKQGMAWQIAFGITAFIFSTIAIALVITHFNEIENKRRDERYKSRGY